MSFEIPDPHRQSRQIPGFTQRPTAILRDNRDRHLSHFPLAMLNELLDEILDMDPPGLGDESDTGFSFNMGWMLPEADAGTADG